MLIRNTYLKSTEEGQFPFTGYHLLMERLQSRLPPPDAIQPRPENPMKLIELTGELALKVNKHQRSFDYDPTLHARYVPVLAEMAFTAHRMAESTGASSEPEENQDPLRYHDLPEDLESGHDTEAWVAEITRLALRTSQVMIRAQANRPEPDTIDPDGEIGSRNAVIYRALVSLQIGIEAWIHAVEDTANRTTRRAAIMTWREKVATNGRERNKNDDG